jgi:hypothetical protein
MKKIIIFIIVLFLTGCSQYTYPTLNKKHNKSLVQRYHIKQLPCSPWDETNNVRFGPL